MTEAVCHDTCTGDVPLVQSVPYQIPKRWRGQVREELLALVEQGILVPLSSQWSSPVVQVPKKVGSVRICVDF